MTYTFKLARRLAASPLSGLIALSSLAACAAGDTMAPTDLAQNNWRDRTDLAVSVSPASVNLEVNEAARFSGRVHTPTGDSVSAPVTWSATGGAIDATGAYVAGATAGTFVVVAANADGSIADTAHVTIAPPATIDAPVPTPEPETPTTDEGPTPTPEPTPAPAPAPAPAPVPTLTKVILTPSAVALLTGATKQVTVYGQLSDGDSVAVAVTYTATGGTVSATGLYTAGTTAGAYRVIAKASNGVADTTAVTLTAPVIPVTPTPTPSHTGIAYGAFSLASSGAATGALNLSLDPYSASSIVSQITTARSKGLHLFLALTGGSHANYLTNNTFDRAKWNAKVQTFNTPAIKAAITAAVADGTILGASVMDEPNVAGEGDGNTWGPVGTMTKVRVDSLCGYVKAIFPTLPAGVVHRYDMFEPTKSYRVCDFLVNQYSAAINNVTAFRDGALAMGRRDGMTMAFSLNILDGGNRDKDGTYDCAGTGGMGTYGTNCSMTGAQVTDFGTTLGSAGCALLMWKYSATYAAQTAIQQAFGTVAGRLASLPAKACRRS